MMPTKWDMTQESWNNLIQDVHDIKRHLISELGDGVNTTGNVKRIINEYYEDLKKVKYDLYGNGQPEKNFLNKVNVLWDMHLQNKKTSLGLVDWVYRWIIAAILGAICAKVFNYIP